MMKNSSGALCALFASLIFAAAARCDEIAPAGHQLALALDGMNVENLWLAKRYVNWQTGEPTDKEVTDGKSHTHCSAFAAAACERLGVYLLRPPEHKAAMLANAQFDWLAADGRQQGWKPVATGKEAQHLANSGHLVVVVFKEPDPKKAGHIAIVRPSEKGATEIEQEGPQIIQAGMSNYRSASAKTGFQHHAAAWPGGVRYFAHDVEAGKLPVSRIK